MRRLLIVATVVALSLSSIELAAHARAEMTSARGDLLLFALGGALAGSEGLHFLCHQLPGIGWNDITCAFFGLFGYLIGVPLGATVGVGITGRIQKAPGNIWAALLGAAAGEGVAVGAIILLSAFVENNPAFQGLASALGPFFTYFAIPVSAGFGAAWGYAQWEMSQSRSAAGTSSP